jgi:hypothetical protein
MLHDVPLQDLEQQFEAARERVLHRIDVALERLRQIDEEIQRRKTSPSKRH